MSGTLLEQFAAASAELDRACEVLLSPTPEALERCSSVLDSAVCRIESFGPQLAEARGDARALEAAYRVRRSFLHAAQLLENAASFHGTWLSIRGAMTGGYTDRGEAAPLRQIGRLSIEA